MNRPLLLIVGAAGVFALTASGTAARTAPRKLEPTRTVFDSVYTDSQAAVGDSLYKVNCVKCHGPTLGGVDDGSPLVGSAFLSDWNGQTLADLHDRVRTTMPPDNPKSIARDQVTTILAYLLAQNHFPSGRRLLVDDPDSLRDIKILSGKP
jgi:S-disulfanyl-L-cysteine oxidoreductase SoxD